MNYRYKSIYVGVCLYIRVHVYKHTFAIFWFWWYINGYAREDPWGREIHKYLGGNDGSHISNVSGEKKLYTVIVTFVFRNVTKLIKTLFQHKNQ